MPNRKRIGIVIQFMAGEKGNKADFLGASMDKVNSNAGNIWFYQQVVCTVISAAVQTNNRWMGCAVIQVLLVIIIVKFLSGVLYRLMSLNFLVTYSQPMLSLISIIRIPSCPV